MHWNNLAIFNLSGTTPDEIEQLKRYANRTDNKNARVRTDNKNLII